MNKKQLKAALTEAGVEFNDKATNAEFEALLAAVEAPPEVEAPPPAIVDDDIVTCRGKGFGGATRMPRSEFNAAFRFAAFSEFNAMQKKKDGKD